MGDVFGGNGGFEKGIGKVVRWWDVGEGDRKEGVGVIGKMKLVRLCFWEVNIDRGWLEIREEWGMDKVRELEMVEGGLCGRVGKRKSEGREVGCVLGYGV